jgi:thioredoxin reductase (NADPH)
MTNSIENFPGFEEISGFELMDKMKQQAIKLGVQFVTDHIVEVDFAHRPFICSSENGHSYKARAVIVATGSSAKWLNLSSEKKYLGFGVSACATCDGFFYRGSTVAVIGGGNSAVAETLYLATLAEKVYLIHRRHQMPESEELSDRERDVLVQVVRGLSNKEIADVLCISMHTVISHRKNITRKLNIHSTAGLTIYAIVNKLVDLNSLE